MALMTRRMRKTVFPLTVLLLQEAVPGSHGPCKVRQYNVPLNARATRRRGDSPHCGRACYISKQIVTNDKGEELPQMTIDEITSIVDGRSVTSISASDEIRYAFSSDLMSDVLTVLEDGVLLITGLVNIQTVRTASMADISTVLLVRGKTATSEMIDLATEHGIVLLETAYSMFRASGVLYDAGLKPLF